MNKSDSYHKTEQFFGPESPLRTSGVFVDREYEERPQQEEMSLAVAEAMSMNRHLCVEAPTGVGKSFAYLVPAIYQSIYTASKIIVSTHTINLQEQLVEKDLELLKSILPVSFKVVLAKGRENFLCHRRMEAAWQNPADFLFDDDNLSELNRVKTWVTTSKTGSRTELEPMVDPAIWTQVCCESGNCSGPRCHFFKDCFMMQMKMEMADANIIVTNHSLFFVDLAIKNSLPEEEGTADGILPKFSTVIFDEAHTIEESAATHLGVRASSGGLFHMLNRLYVKRKSGKDRGLISASRWSNAQEVILKFRSRAEDYFQTLTDWVLEQKDQPLRYTMPNHIPHILHEDFCDLDAALKEVIDLEVLENNQQEIQSIKDRLYEYNQAMQIFLGMSEPGFVYWFETKESSSGSHSIALIGVPIEVNDILDNLLFRQKFSVVMTSATLAVRQNLNYFLARIGAKGIATSILSSPFDYKKQVEILLPEKMPSPKTDSFYAPAIEAIKQFISESNGKTMVLFTSYFMMRKMADELRPFLLRKGINLLQQGEKMANSAIIREMKRDPKSVIFGTSSFWTGVDIPGETLTTVVIVRIPFAVPSFPLNQARMEMIEAHGGNSFRDYTLPEAILKFRQGFGRLIRSKSDHGKVAILDSRINTTFYGQQFIDSIPECDIKKF